MAQLGLFSDSNSKLRFLQVSDTTVNNTNTSSNITGQRSGGTLPTTYMAYVDPYGQIVGSDWNSKISLDIAATYNSNGTSV
jgi:hypothetical protein